MNAALDEATIVRNSLFKGDEFDVTTGNVGLDVEMPMVGGKDLRAASDSVFSKLTKRFSKKDCCISKSYPFHF